jgi:hypothetical protein
MIKDTQANDKQQTWGVTSTLHLDVGYVNIHSRKFHVLGVDSLWGDI